MRALFVFLLVFGAFECDPALAQDAQIFGQIRDPSNASVDGADVTLRNEQTGGTRNTKSNESGFFSLPDLRPGTYRLMVRAIGFQTIVREGIQLEVGDSARLDFALTIGSSQTTITVRGGPPLINTVDASIGTVIDRNLIDQMPLNGRGIQTLVELTPGVVVVPVVDVSRGQFVINGQRSGANYFTVDGVSANFSVANSPSLEFLHSTTTTAGQAGGGMLPANNFLGTFSNLLSPEALEEFKIQTSTYAPEFGHLPGGQIDLISRSGTKRYSASLFEYLRNDATDANDWFSDMQGLPKAALRFNNFGGTLGGPVRLPHLYDGKDRTFFFFSADLLTIHQPQPTVTILVPTLSARESAPPALAALLNAYPIPNDTSLGGTPLPLGFAQFVGAAPLQYDQRAYSLRVDHNFSDKLAVFLRYSHAPSKRIEPVAYYQTPSNLDSYTIGTDSITVGLTQSISPHWVNEIRLNASKQSAGDTAYLNKEFGGIPPAISQFLPPGYSSANSNASFDVGKTNRVPVIYLGMISKNEARQIEGLDNLSYNHGAHLLRFGIDYRWFSPVQIIPAYQTFSSLGGIYEAPGSFISTIPEIETTVSALNKTAYVVPTFAAYAQDTWRLSPSFTINYGLRWEVDPAPRVSAGQALVAGGLTNLNDTSTVYALAAGQPFYPTTHGNFAPRVGVARQLLSRGQMMTVLRAGAGVFFSSAQGDFEDTPLNARVLSIYTNQPLGSLGTGTPSQMINLDPAAVTAVVAAPHYKLPVVYQWNVTLEQAIGQQTFSVGYVGAVGRRLIGSGDLLSLSAEPELSFLHVLGNDTNSSYNALQAQFNRRLSHKLQILTSYTFSHSIDNLSQDLPPFLAPRSLSQFLNPKADRGPSDFDIRHSLNGAVIVELPAPRRAVAAVLLRNWSANGIFFARSALPTDILDPSNLDLRPDYVRGQPLYLYGSQYPGGKAYNKAAFKSAAFLKEGNFGRNVLRGFGAWQMDFAIHRKFEFSERTSLEFRAEAFNILNHPNFANPSDSGEPTSLFLEQTPHWGESSAMLANGLGATLIPGELNPLFQIGGPRTLQFALRFRY
jgi:outer membrane receptor protein involved in Fe transport